MAYLTNKFPHGKVAFEFQKLLAHQDFVEHLDMFNDYTVDCFYRDVCSILKNNEYMKENSLLKRVFYLMNFVTFNSNYKNFSLLKTTIRIL